MKYIKAIGIFNIIVGAIWLFAPIKFYSIAMKLFTPEVSPPFELGTIRLLTVLLLLPAIILVLNGIALVAMNMKLERVPEFRAFSDSGEYIGRLKGIEMGEGEVETFEVEGTTLDKKDVTAVDDILIVKEKKGYKGPAHKNVFEGKEIYTRRGDYLGKVESVTLNAEGKPIEFVAVKGKKKKVIQANSVDSTNDVIIVKL